MALFLYRNPFVLTMNEVYERQFDHFPALPVRARSRVIDKMKPDDRCRLTRCSKLCRKEAWNSKNYVYYFGVASLSKTHIKIDVAHHKDEYHGFQVVFTEENQKKLKKYIIRTRGLLWETELDNSVDLFQCAMEEVRRMMSMYQNSVKKMVINGISMVDRLNILTNVQFGIESLNNLEHLELFGDFDHSQFVTKVRKPLKKLEMRGGKNSAQIANCKQVYQVKEELICWDMGFNYQQFSQLSAKKALMHIGSLNEKHIFNFIRSWQDGTVGRNIEWYHWSVRNDSIFNSLKFFRLLRYRDREIGRVEVKHFYNDGKSAEVAYSGQHLSFVPRRVPRV